LPHRQNPIDRGTACSEDDPLRITVAALAAKWRRRNFDQSPRPEATGPR
jgi:hypothetical protein